ncbi:MAG: cupin domain-containing protein [Propioniciclava sp.]
MSEQPTMTAIANLNDEIALQSEATVSKTVMKAEGARVVCFAFDTGQVLTEHTAAMPVLLAVTEGRLRITADGRDVELVPGGLIHFGTRLPHAVEALEPSKLTLMMLDPR